MITATYNQAPTVFVSRIPLRQLIAPGIFVALLACLAIYFIGLEEGAASMINGSYVHEFVHDARHLLGFPCH